MSRVCEEHPGPGRLRGHRNLVINKPGALFAMQHNRWDRALKVTAGGTGMVGHAGVSHAGAVLFRKAADQAGTDRAAEHGTDTAGPYPVVPWRRGADDTAVGAGYGWARWHLGWS